MQLLRRTAQGIIAVLLATAVIMLVFVVPDLLVDFPPQEDNPGLGAGDYVNAVIQERRTVIALLAGLGAAVSLWYTHRRHQLEQDRNRTDRFNTAVEHLGHDKAAVRLGGIYALERVGIDSKRDAAAVVQILSTLVRSGRPSR